MDFQMEALVPVRHERRKRKMRFVRARVLVLAFGLGILLCLIWVRSMDKPEGGVVPVVSVTYEAVEHGS